MASSVLFVALVACGDSKGGDATDGGAGAPDGGAPPDAPPASNRISGTVTGYALSAVDSDVNDPNAPHASNDSIQSAQALSVPFTLGGYLNVPGAGPDGRSKAAGDVIDVFRVSATAGQLVMLSFDVDDPAGAQDARNAFQIYLLDTNGEPVEDGDGYPIEGRYHAESMRYFFIERSDEYLIAVEAIKGASTYVLVVDDYHGKGGMASGPAPYVRGEVVARFRPGSLPATVRAGDRHRGLDVRAGAPRREMLLGFDTAHPERFVGRWGGNHLIRPASQLPHQRRPLRGPITPRTAAMLLEADPSVSVAGANFIVKPMLVPDDQYYGNQWAWNNIKAEAAWDSADGSGVIVAVVDTGADRDHPDLAANLVAGYDFVRDPENGDGDGIDPDPQQNPSGHHGTHVAGTIAAVTNNDRGVAGLAWGAKVMPLRGLTYAGGTEYDIGQAVRYAAGLDNDSGTLPETPARVVNMSLGGPENSRWFQRVVFDAVRAGTVIVAAAGNDNSSSPSYPASYKHVISVSSTTSGNNKSGFSNYGPNVDVAAPGSQILSTWGGGGYNAISGTSMACPHAAAWVALMISANPQLTAIDIETIIQNEDVFTDLGQPGRDDVFGYGLIDADKAVAVAASYSAGAAAVIPELATTPDQIILGPTQSTATITGANIGDGTLDVTAATAAASWVSVGGFMSVPNGVELSVTVDRGQLVSPGIYSTDVNLEVDGEMFELPVIAIVRDNSQPSDLGALYVSLVDAGGDTWGTAAVVDGSFEISSVPNGDYAVYVGSDLDNDASTCGRGEVCGAHTGIEAVTTVSPTVQDVALVGDWLFQSSLDIRRSQ